MEHKSEDVKIGMHSQYARILKEEDEVWISSEDLNTENSTDEEKGRTKNALKKKLKTKHRKRSTPNIKLERPSNPSLPSTSKTFDDRLLMPKQDDHQCKSDESRTSDEEYSLPPVSPDCLSKRFSLQDWKPIKGIKRLSLEDWRPIRGALNISSADESAGEARKLLKETNTFCNTMIYKLKSLKSGLKTETEETHEATDVLPKEEKTFKFLKNTPEVKQKLEFIKNLDEEINRTISTYQSEREERLSTEFEMCKSISEQKLNIERDADKFLKMCGYEEKLKGFKTASEQLLPPVYQEDIHEDRSIVEDTNKENSSDNIKPIVEGPDMSLTPSSSENFIKRNIRAAHEGVMANYSITDEEKTKIAEILKDIDDFQLNDAELSLSESLIGNVETIDNSSVMDANITNGFSIIDSDKNRMSEIDDQLEKFAEDEKNNEKCKIKRDAISPVTDDKFWKQYVLEQTLKDIDAQLEKLYESYTQDEEQLRNFSKSEAEEVTNQP